MSADIALNHIKTMKTNSFSPNNGIMTPTFPMVTPGYAIVSPVLLPYVQAPVCYAKSKSKKNVENQTSTTYKSVLQESGSIKTKSKKKEQAKVATSHVKVRYVPAYKLIPLQPSYMCHTGNSFGSPNMSQRLGIPFAMRINPEARRLNQGYVSALSPPGAYTVNNDFDVSKSDLNPLSRPYTPPSRLKPCTCSGKANSLEEILCSKCQQLNVSSSDSCSGSISGESRVNTPLSSYSLSWSERNEESFSDSDSGVEREVEDGKVKNSDLLFKFDKPSFRESEEESSIEDLIEVFNTFSQTNCEQVKEDLSPQLARVVDFLCVHLNSCEWRTVARELGVNEVIIQSVEYDFYESYRDQMKFVFSVWANSQKSKSCGDIHDLTVLALSEIGRLDLVELLNKNEKD